MDKNTIIGFVLIGLILILWPLYQREIIGEKTAAPTQEQTEEAAPSPSFSRVTPIEAEPTRVTPAPSLEAIALPPDADRPDTVVIENALFRAELSSRGGGTVLSWKLKTFERYEIDVLTGETVKVPIDLIPDFGRADNLGFRMTLPDGTEHDLAHTVFEMTETDAQGARFEKKITGKGRIIREIRTGPDRFDIDVRTRFVSERETPGRSWVRVNWKTGLSPTEKNVRDEDAYHQAFALQGGELLKEKKGDTGVREGATDWMALRNKYFIMAMIPEKNGSAVQLAAQRERIRVNDFSGNQVDWKNFHCALYLDSDTGTPETVFRLFLGPLEYNLLKAYDVKLEKTMDFGWAIIRVFSIPLYHALAFLGRVLGNYGLAIIVLSILIKAVLYPLTRKSYQSMRDMQALQPKVAALKEKYAKDPQRLNQETMKIYKEHGVNPMGGCLPMLLQMPVLFALFSLFRSTIMFRQATFGPIHDLSAPDGLIPIGATAIHILPILMGITTMLQQKQTVQDPKQKMMAYFMPIFLTFIFYRMSAGLNLYYLMFNLLTIAQEHLVRRSKAKGA
ncbi:MAG TPA: membrane protein insertase YidC [bacterium]|nr:membrane protein insertase YidC [bacterium]